MSMTNGKRRVYIPHIGYHEYDAAVRFGELVDLLRGRIALENSDRLEGRLQDLLADAEEDDYILISGNTLANVLATGYMAQRFGKVNLLVWDPMIRDYRLHTTTFENRMEKVDRAIERSREQ